MLRKKPLADEEDSLVGEEGADLDKGGRVTPDGGTGNIREL